MKPYYDHKGITIYHGDCIEIMPQLEHVDLVLTDPPYGISFVGNGRDVGGSNLAKCNNYIPMKGDKFKYDMEFLTSRQIPVSIWGANHFSGLPAATCWLIWDKRVNNKSDMFADVELAWTNYKGPARIFCYPWKGMIRPKPEMERIRVHPTQKPINVMKWNIGFIDDGTIADPFMGSGTTLVAAKELGRNCIGIEIEEKYCEIAARRLAQEMLF